MIKYTHVGQGHLQAEVVDEPFVTRVSRETARNDVDVEIPVGAVWVLKPTNIGGKPVDGLDVPPYYYMGGVTGTIVGGGFDNESPGDEIRKHFQIYGYELFQHVDPVAAVRHALKVQVTSLRHAVETGRQVDAGYLARRLETVSSWLDD